MATILVILRKMNQSNFVHFKQ